MCFTRAIDLTTLVCRITINCKADKKFKPLPHSQHDLYTKTTNQGKTKKSLQTSLLKRFN